MVAALVAGSIALFAPCCVSVMLPAYFAAGFHNRRALVAMTFVFAAGVATVILPIALGAVAFRRLFAAQHSTIYVVGGLFMLALALYLLWGGKIHFPMPGRRAGNKSGPVAVYSLGAFSGVAGACCAPVLAGVIALSGLAASFGWALVLGLTFVFGMVAPLFVISLLWERYDWRSSPLFRPRNFRLSLGPVTRQVSGTNLAAGGLLGIMGLASIWNGLANSAMAGLTGWQAWFSLKLQRAGRAVTEKDLPEAIRAHSASDQISNLELTIPMKMDDLEQIIINKTLVYTNGDKAKAARLLGIGRKTLYRKLEQYRKP